MRYANIRIRGIEMQKVYVRRWTVYALEVVELAGGLYVSGKYELLSGVVLVQLCVCAKMVNEIL